MQAGLSCRQVQRDGTVHSWESLPEFLLQTAGASNLPPVGCESELGGTEALLLPLQEGSLQQGLLPAVVVGADGQQRCDGKGDEGKVSEPL